MAKRATFVSLESYKLTGVHVTNHELGVGSSATVVELEYLGLKCAGKKIHEFLLKCGDNNNDEAHRFSEECHLLSRVSHPNIVQFLGVHFQSEIQHPILVMEFLPTDLSSCITEHGVLPNEISYSILRDIAQGLAYLHGQKPRIIHRDLSSNNILLTPILGAKIADLGVARILNMSPLQASTMTKNPGTPIYMPPEAMVESPHYDTSIDSFSYGILMILILCGQRPKPHIGPNRHESGRLIAVSEAQRRENFLQMIGRDHPLMNLILKCIDNNPKERPSADTIIDQLNEKVQVVPPSFKQQMETLKYVAEREVEKSKEKEQHEVREKEGRKIKRSIWSLPRSYVIFGFLLVISVILAYNAGLNVHSGLETRILNSSKEYINHSAIREQGQKFLSAIKERGQKFLNTTFNECILKETMACDYFVPTVIQNLGHISWRSGKDLESSMYKGQYVVIGEKVCFGGGFADKEVHKYNVHCYHLKSDEWTTLNYLPVKSFGLGKFNGKLVAVGGITIVGEPSHNVYTYDETLRSWDNTSIPNMQESRSFPAVLSLPSTLVVAGGGASIEIYTEDTGWYWSDHPLPNSCTDVTLNVAGNTCFALGGNYSREMLSSDWYPLALYGPLENLLWDRNKTAPGMAYKYRNTIIYPSYRWRNLPGGPQAYSLVATVLARNLLTLGKRGNPFDKQLRMLSLTNESWSEIGQLPDGLQVDSATMTALSSTELFVTGKKLNGFLSVYIGTIEIF